MVTGRSTVKSESQIGQLFVSAMRVYCTRRSRLEMPSNVAPSSQCSRTMQNDLNLHLYGFSTYRHYILNKSSSVTSDCTWFR